MNLRQRLTSIRISGYRPFVDFEASLGALEVLVGANGSGKSSLFEFLRFLRDAVRQEIPPEIVPGGAGQQIFHSPGPERFQWAIDISGVPEPGVRYESRAADATGPWQRSLENQERSVRYEGELLGPVGSVRIPYERVIKAPGPPAVRPVSPPAGVRIPGGGGRRYKRAIKAPGRDVISAIGGPRLLLNFEGGRGSISDPEPLLPPRPGEPAQPPKAITVRRSNQLALATLTTHNMTTLYPLREYILGWRFYSSFSIATEKLRRPVPVEQQPLLNEDAGNLSAVLHYLLTEHPPEFEETEVHLRSVVPCFRRLTVKARGGPGEVIAFWNEAGSDMDLSLADLSDGILRLLCWIVLCVHPDPPCLVCIDEPDLGVHPRTLPLLAGLMEKASDRTQFLLATHNSFFLMQFELSGIAVMRKTEGRAEFVKPADSKTLRDILSDFGPAEIEAMHRSDELEHLA